MPFNSPHRAGLSDLWDIPGFESVLKYGATGDSITDDTEAIQAAIDAAKDANLPGRLFFPTGRYYLSAPLVIDRRIEIVGAGYGTHIFQSADVNLFEFEPFVSGACSRSYIGNMYLGSAATSVGTSLLYLHVMASTVVENIILAGGYYGIHIHGSLFNTIRDCYHARQGFFGSTPNLFSEQQIAIYMIYDGGTHCNGNVFINNTLGFGQYGLYVDEGNGEGNFHWYGGRIEQGCDYGVYVKGASNFSIEGLHLEGDAGTCGITLEGCTTGRIAGDRYQNMSIINSSRISIIGGLYSSLNINKWSRDIIIENTHAGLGGTVIESSTTDSNHMTLASGPYFNIAGKSNRSIRNRIDGDFKVWSGGAPLGWTVAGTGAIVSEEATIVRFGSKSAKIQVGAGQTTAVLRYDMDVDRYSKMGLTNYRSSAYKWTASGSGTNEYYVELAAGGDPGILAKPEILGAFGGVLVNDVWATEGSMGSLAAGEWDYGDNDSLGYDTIYLRLGDDADPDVKAIGYVQARHKVYPFTVSCWVYKPETNGANPTLTFYYGPPGAGDGGVVAVPFDEWTRISWTFFPRSGKTYGRIYIGFLSGAANNIIYVDGVELVDGDTMSPIYDDSRGLDGDFRVGGSLLRSGEVSDMAGHETFAWGDGNIFIKDPDGAGRNFNPTGAFPQFAEIYLTNAADDAETITFDSAGLNQAVAQDERAHFIFDGTNWTLFLLG